MALLEYYGPTTTEATRSRLLLSARGRALSLLLDGFAVRGARSHSEINEVAHPANVLECVSCSVFARRRDRAQNNSVAVARLLVIEVRNFTRV
jgi:hypothetical protein